jgi:PTS system mannose-specific IIC component
LASLITGLFYLRRKVGFKLKVFLHPILLSPLVGACFGWSGFTTGVMIGAIVELLWGSNLVDYQAGLKYGVLASLLTVVLIDLTGNISVFFNLSLVLILVFSFQVAVSSLTDKKYFPGLVFLFNLIVLSGAPLIKLILGQLPAQFLNNIEVAGGLSPAVGLALLLLEAVKPTFKRNNVWYYSYCLAAIVTSAFVLNNRYLGLMFFPLIWYTGYYFWAQVRDLTVKDYLQRAVILLAVIFAPVIVEINSYFVNGTIQQILWVDAVLGLAASLRFFRLTPIESYFIIMLLGIAGSQFAILG